MKCTKVELLERAQGLLEAAIVLIEEATEGHGFLCNNLTIEKVINKYEGEEEIEISEEAEGIMEGNF
jgi:hypothetical protein